MHEIINHILSNPSHYINIFLAAISAYGLGMYTNLKIKHYKYCKHKFVRASIPKNIKEVKVSPSLENKIKDFNTDIFSKKYLEYAKEFIDVVRENFAEKDTQLLKNNIGTLLVYDINDLKEYPKYIFGKSAACYTSVTNELYLFEKKFNIITLMHELFHASSSKYIGGVVYSGFHQINKDDTYIGEGLNEGYTQLLTIRYFEKYNTIDAYDYLVKYAGIIEGFIGKEKMQSLYMNADLRSLIDELSNYSSIEDTMQFLNDLDIVCKFFYQSKVEFRFQRVETNKAMKRINKYITHAIIEYYKQESINSIKDGKKPKIYKIECFDILVQFLKVNLTKKYINDDCCHFRCYMSDKKTKYEIRNHINEAWKSIEEAKNEYLSR